LPSNSATRPAGKPWEAKGPQGNSQVVILAIFGTDSHGPGTLHLLPPLPMIHFLLNDKVRGTDASPGSVALDYLRSVACLKGGKEGCREGDCGVCALLVGAPDGHGALDYRTVPSCLLPVAELQGRHVVTIEGLNGEQLTPVQQAIVEEGATQCGFCTPGIVLGLTSFLLNSPDLSMTDALASIEGHLCRCTGYVSLRRAAQRLAETLGPYLRQSEDRLSALVDAGVLPASFLEAPSIVAGLETSCPKQTGEPAVPLGGGTDLYVQNADELLNADLRLLCREPALSTIEAEGEGLALGGAVTVEDLVRSPLLKERRPEMQHALRLVASQLIRNRATVAGNLVNASPIGDLAIMLLALNADLQLQLEGVRRRVPLSGFFKAYKRTCLAPGEIVARIHIPPTGLDSRFHFEKVSRRTYLDIATVNTAVLVQVDGPMVRDVALSAGGVAALPMRLRQAEEALRGAPLTPEAVRHAADAADREVSPISDVRGSAMYKRRLLRGLLFAHFIALFPDLHVEEGLA